MEEQNKNTEKKENEVQTSQENTPQNATPTCWEPALRARPLRRSW